MDLVERLVVAEPPLSTAQKVLVVAEGGTFRARLDGDGPNLGLTLKATRDGRALVQALPAPSRAKIRARAASLTTIHCWAMIVSLSW